MSTRKFRLNDQATSFVDPDTGFEITLDEEKEITVGKGVGKATLRAIKAGGLIEVKTAAEKKGAKGTKSGSSDGELPDGFPARAALIKAGFDTVDKVKAASDQELIDVKGVGESTVEHIRDAVK